MKVLDWDKLKTFVSERNPVEVDAGILNDWYWTAATVYKDGKYIDEHHAWVESSWATPGFKATLENGDIIEVTCFKTEGD